MINYSAIEPRSWLGGLLRAPLRLLPTGASIPVLQGPLKGRKWIVGSSNHGCWLGSYECEKQRRIANTVRPGEVFLDIGANVGFYTLLAAKSVTDTGKVLAFEPLPANVQALKRHLNINRVKNVELFEAAVAEKPGSARFARGPNGSMGQLSREGELLVQVMSLDDLFARKKIPLPDHIKIDVEGAEAAVLEGAREMLAVSRPTIYLATHGPRAHEACLKLLRCLSYTCEPLTQGTNLENCDEIVAFRP